MALTLAIQNNSVRHCNKTLLNACHSEGEKQTPKCLRFYINHMPQDNSSQKVSSEMFI